MQYRDQSSLLFIFPYINKNGPLNRTAERGIIRISVQYFQVVRNFLEYLELI